VNDEKIESTAPTTTRDCPDNSQLTALATDKRKTSSRKYRLLYLFYRYFVKINSTKLSMFVFINAFDLNVKLSRYIKM